MKKTFILILIAIVFIPSVTFASWWNPFTWKIFKRSAEIKVEQTTTIPSNPTNTTSQTVEESSKTDQPKIEKVIPNTNTKSTSKTMNKKVSNLFDTETWEQYSSKFEKNIIVPNYAERIRRVTKVCNYIESDFKVSTPYFKKYPYCSDGENSDGTIVESYLTRVQNSRYSKEDTFKVWEIIQAFEVGKLALENNSQVIGKVSVPSTISSWKAIEDYLLPIADGQGLTDFFTMNDETNDSRTYVKENNKWIWKSGGKSKINLFGGPSYNFPNSSGKNTLVCNTKPWSLCPAGQKFSCPETGSPSCVSSSVAKNNDKETNQPSTTSNQQDFTRPAGAPSSAQLRRLMAMCSLSEKIATACNSPIFIKGYFTDIEFRTLIDDLAIKTAQTLAEQKAQNELAQQRYLLYLQTIKQPTIQPLPRSETYSLPLYSGSLKLEPPQVNSPRKWEIQWTGGGAGFIKDYSSGTQTNFLCDSNRCFNP